MARIGFDIMCGIAGFSLSSTSKVNARKLAHELLCGIESRGGQASGVAWQSGKGSGFFKQDVAGSRLSLKTMDKRSRVAVLHTRLATHGSVKVNANNHPVLSPDKSISLVHNGVIYNHDIVRKQFVGSLAEVDTAVIPAIVQSFGFERFDMLDGDASVAWLDENNRGVLMVGRLSHSPLCVAQLHDGSFVFASTEALLRRALDNLGLSFSFLASVEERTLLTVREGRIDGVDVLPATSPEFEVKVSASSYKGYRNMTAGFGSEDGWDDYASPASDEVAEEFEDFLCNFYESDGQFFNWDGIYVGDRSTMLEQFEDYRYSQYWAGSGMGESDYASLYTTGSKSFGDWD
jgi:glucosamine 6-phosphate synthetase-like amidotransferase/phosphosugar isomerase protein